MDTSAFWHLIEKSRDESSRCEEQAERLVELLRNLNPEDIVEFKKHFSKCLDDSYRWDLWAVAVIVASRSTSSLGSFLWAPGH